MSKKENSAPMEPLEEQENQEQPAEAAEVCGEAPAETFTLTKEEMEKPLVGIVSSYNEIVPGHMNLDKIVNAVKLGVAEAGGVPVVFPAIAVCDGIAMGHTGMKYSLVTRDLIAGDRHRPG